jgi:hypothetical protein
MVYLGGSQYWQVKSKADQYLINSLNGCNTFIVIVQQWFSHRQL